MTQESTNDFIIEVNQLSRQFDQKIALNNINIRVKRGQVFGIVGENGAGKTTLIKHLLGSLSAQQGSVRVFGYDPVEKPEKALAHIGYLSEEPELPEWMTIKQYLNYMSAFYPNWDHDYANQLLVSFNLNESLKIKGLSKGQRARTGLIAAQAHRPDLLLLDEPSSGLDPIIRKDILQAVIRTVVDEGRSVVLSSHFLDEVERVCDHLALFNQGQVLLSEPMEDVLSKHFEFVVRASENSDWSNNPEIFKSEYQYGEWLLSGYGTDAELKQSILDSGGEVVSHRLMSLNEIFVARSPSKQALPSRAEAASEQVVVS